jgi:putative Holliday junction resolvase
MAIANLQYMALDVGTVRIGIALASNDVRIALPYETIPMNEETFAEDIAKRIHQHNIDVLVVGYPRNQSGDATQQTAYVEKMIQKLPPELARVVYQDESLTSVVAKERRQNGVKEKGEIDAEAAAIILQDYLEQHA